VVVGAGMGRNGQEIHARRRRIEKKIQKKKKGRKMNKKQLPWQYRTNYYTCTWTAQHISLLLCPSPLSLKVPLSTAVRGNGMRGPRDN
jgi:hypothetical protein